MTGACIKCDFNDTPAVRPIFQIMWNSWQDNHNRPPVWHPASVFMCLFYDRIHKARYWLQCRLLFCGKSYCNVHYRGNTGMLDVVLMYSVTNLLSINLNHYWNCCPCDLISTLCILPVALSSLYSRRLLSGCCWAGNKQQSNCDCRQSQRIAFIEHLLHHICLFEENQFILKCKEQHE